MAPMRSQRILSGHVAGATDFDRVVAAHWVDGGRIEGVVTRRCVDSHGIASVFNFMCLVITQRLGAGEAINDG